MQRSITSPLHAAALLAIAFGALLSLAGCGSSTSTATAPAVLPRCGVTVSPMDGSAPSQGATGQLTISTARECSWSALSEVPWLTIRGTSSGQGDGSIEYTVAANADPVTRRGTIAINDQHPAVSQAAADCTIRLSAASASFPLTGGSGSVDVQPSSAQCTWTTSSEADWVVINGPANGTGNGTVRFTVSATTGPARTANLVIGGQRFNITQSEGCTYSAAPSSQNVPAAGGSGSITVTTGAGCPWTAASNANWISITGNSSGSGPGSVSFAAESTSGPSRTGTLLIAGQTITITQASACAFTVSPTTHNIGSGGGSANVSISASAGCTWTASSDVPWITMAGQTSGTGGANVTFNVAANTGGARTGTLTIAGQAVSVTQGEGCSISIAPESQDVAASGGNGSVSVTASAGCSWTAVSNASWITVTSGASGTGNGTVQFTAASTTASRSGTITIAGKTFTVNQGQQQTCTVSLGSTTLDIGVGGGTGSVQVTAGGGCAWTAATSAPWITINSGSNGSGNGTVAFTVGTNTGAARTGTITIAGQTFTVNQAASPSCTVGISPTSTDVPVAGGTRSIAVSAPSGCGWTATTSASWISITSGASGSGDGTVAVSIAANTGAARSGTINIGGQTFTVNQAQACTVGISPASSDIAAGGGNGSITVTASAACAWTTTAGAPWITITSGASGSGNGTVAFTAAANSGGARNASITVGGQVHTVNQAAVNPSCTYSLAPANQNVPVGGGNGSVNVTAGSGCAWTSTKDAAWLTITGGAGGTGNGTVAFSAAANTGPARTATITVAGQTATVQQAAGSSCTYSLAPANQNVPVAGGNGSINVTAGSGCAWTASKDAAWLTITGGASGTGNGTIAFTAAANTGPARTATVTVAGQTATVQQATGCTFTINSTEVTIRKQGDRVSVAVSTAAGCSWTAASPVSWITIDSGASGTGNGTVVIDVERNTGNADTRTANVTIAGLTFKVTQQD